MTPEPRPPAPGSDSTAGIGAVIGRVLAGLASAVAGTVFLFTAWMAISSRFGLTDRDVHGYGLIFGSFLAVISGFVLAVVLPLVFPRRLWNRVYTLTLLSFAVVFVLLIAAVLTA
jgi:hypothetical protein